MAEAAARLDAARLATALGGGRDAHSRAVGIGRAGCFIPRGVEVHRSGALDRSVAIGRDVRTLEVGIALGRLDVEVAAGREAAHHRLAGGRLFVLMAVPAGRFGLYRLPIVRAACRERVAQYV